MPYAMLATQQDDRHEARPMWRQLLRSNTERRDEAALLPGTDRGAGRQ